MKVAVLPFNAGPDTEPALARQAANFVGEIARQISQVEVNPVSYMGRADEDGMARFAHINPSEALNDSKMIQDFFGQSDAEKLIDGLLAETPEGAGTLTARWHNRGSDEPDLEKEYAYLPGGMLSALRDFVVDFMTQIEAEIPDDFKNDTGLFGTGDSEAFRMFLIGYDATQYVERSKGMVLSSFDPKVAMEALASAAESDSEWEGPYLTLIEFVRLCVQYQLGNAEMVEGSLKRLTELAPEDARAWFALGGLYQAVGDHQSATVAYEKAHNAQPDEPAILTRLGQSQMSLAMPVNAEKTLRKAIELEGDDKPTMDLLAAVLAQTGRGHEVPDLWKKIISDSPQNGDARAKLALAFIALKRESEAKDEFEKGLTELDDPTVIKRYYAPFLAKQEEFDKAMDFYEDVLDTNPTDTSVLAEYAQTLSAAKRDFEVPKVLRDILAANPDANTKAMTSAWLLELEEPKRVEAVQSATEKAEKGQFKEAYEELKTLKTWLADYWKLWAILASVLNQLEMWEEAEKAARQTLELYPACEPAYGELCTALSAQNREAEAYRLMKVALGNMPQSLLIAVNYAMAAKRAGDKDEALKVAKQIRELTGDAENLKQVLAEIES